MPYEMPKETIIVKPGRLIQTKSGISLTIIIPTPQCIGDGHSHIENGSCAPLPLLWDKFPLKAKLERSAIDTLSMILKRSTGKVQTMSTFKIGNAIVTESDNAFAPDTLIGKSKLYGSPQADSKVRDFYSFLVVLMMDMEYAHIAGLHGQTIYHEEGSPWYYYERQSGTAEETKGKKILLPGENQLTFSKWRKQLRQTIEAVKANPLRIFPMYFYAPQRWNLSRKSQFDEKHFSGPWDHPFSEIATVKNKGLFPGFKMYSPLGHQPLDPRLPYLHDKSLEGDCFYARCEREGIPIMVHCSPGGMTTHELKFFMDYDTGGTIYQSRLNYSASSSIAPSDASGVSMDKEEMAIRHFYDNYVHPKAWRKVLEKYPKLKLCLAHFGGDEFKKGLNSSWVTEILALTKEYPNVYTDFSCWDMDDCKGHLQELLASVQYSHIREKLIFGTDWYMTLVALGGKSYRSFCEEAWEAFMEIPGGEKLWVNCTFLNLFTFYGFYEKDPQTGVSKLDNIVSSLTTGKHDKAKLSENLGYFKRLKKEFEKLLDERKSARGG